MDQVLHRFISKKGRDIVVRLPILDDVGILLDFAHQLIDEDAYIKISGLQNKDDLSLDNEKKYVEDLLKEIEEKKGIHILAFHNDKLVANVGIGAQSLRKEHVGIMGIAIHKDYRGEGIGKELILFLLTHAKLLGMKMVELKVYGPNARAIHLYKKLGFVETGRLPESIRYKDQFLDEVWMYKLL